MNPFSLGDKIRCHFLGDKASKTHIEHSAKAHELINAHLSFVIKYAPEPFSIDTDAASKLGYAYAAFLPSPLYPLNYEDRMIHSSPVPEHYALSAIERKPDPPS